MNPSSTTDSGILHFLERIAAGIARRLDVPVLSVEAAALLILILFCWYVWASIRRANRPLEVFVNETGRVHVSRAALADLVESAAEQYGLASRPRVGFFVRGGLIHLNVRFKLAAGQRLPGLSSGLQKHIGDHLRESLGLENLGGVHLTVTGFKGDPLKSPVVIGETKTDPPYHGAAATTRPSPPRFGGGDFFSSP